jgi:coenzyme PQQ precursor peptide PqqA
MRQRERSPLHLSADGSIMTSTSTLDVDSFFTHRQRVDAIAEDSFMEWTKPDFTIVAVTMEVTAYTATK